MSRNPYLTIQPEVKSQRKMRSFGSRPLARMTSQTKVQTTGSRYLGREVERQMAAPAFRSSEWVGSAGLDRCATTDCGGFKSAPSPQRGDGAGWDVAGVVAVVNGCRWKPSQSSMLDAPDQKHNHCSDRRRGDR